VPAHATLSPEDGMRSFSSPPFFVVVVVVKTKVHIPKIE